MKDVLSFLVLLPVAFLFGCESSPVPNASCSTCTYTSADCDRAGLAAGCVSWTFEDAPAGACMTTCRFVDCESPPRCMESPADAATDVAMDVPVDPRCEGEDGLFPNCDLCPDDCSMVTFSGATQFTCGCGACPCGFECGSIPAPGGGVLSSVCAPPP